MEDQEAKYYTFPVVDSSKALEINCNAAHGALKLLLNVEGK
jgi:hypothetical protein